MDTDLKANVIRALLSAATHKRVLPWAKFHALFDRSMPVVTRLKVLESALITISDLAAIDYGVLLACDNGLPGDAFFQRYRRYRYDNYVRIMGDPRYCMPKRKQQKLLVDQERARVFLHVQTLRQIEIESECV